MTATVNAIYENGTFRPLEPVTLPEHTPVRLAIDTQPPPAATGHRPQGRELVELLRANPPKLRFTAEEFYQMTRGED